MGENIHLSIRGILAHKMRSFLTMLGIIIGIASIIAIVSTIKGTNDQIEKNLIGAGDNNVNVILSQEDWEYDMSSGIPSGIKEISLDTLKNLATIEHVEAVSTYRKRQDFGSIFHLNHSLSGGNVYGIHSDYFNTAGLTVKKGRGISEKDVERTNHVVVLDEMSAQQLFNGEEVIGKTIEIQSVPFTVIGITVPKVQFEPNIQTMEDYYMYNQVRSGSVYIPETVWPVIYQYDEPQNALFRADSTSAMTEIGREAELVLNGNNMNSNGISYKAQDLMQQAKQIQQLSQSTNTMLLWIAAISLLVGGIGVMNIMLVTVTERTGEIGLKKAIGARKKTILYQFLTEAVVLTSLGGILGVITGIILAKLISILNGTPVSISPTASLFAVLFSMAIGILFGLLPSIKAANLDPIEALRHE